MTPPTLEIRATTGTCPVCIEPAPAAVIEEDGAIFIEKRCPVHGSSRALLSKNPGYYRSLSEFYFDLFPESLPQRDYILRLTASCNLDCPICLASANRYDERDLSGADIRKLTAGRKKLKLDLMGAEPTLRDDLAEIIEKARAQGHITALHTNGIRFGEDGYLDSLIAAGLDEVHLQFDGFDEKHDLLARGRDMGDVRDRAVAALENAGIATDLVVTIIKGSNEAEIPRVLDFAAARPFVKEVFFLGCRPLGNAEADFADNCLVPDETADLFLETTGGRISRDDLRIFQKMYFALLALFRVRKCFYIHHYLLFRKNGGWEPVSERMDLHYLEPRLDRFKSLFGKSRIAAGAYLGFHGVASVLRRGSVRLLAEGARLALLLLFGFNLSRVKSSTLLIGFISACDPWIHDDSVAANCGKGELSTDVGLHDAGADANVARERLHLGLRARPDGGSGSCGIGSNRGGGGEIGDARDRDGGVSENAKDRDGGVDGDARDRDGGVDGDARDRDGGVSENAKDRDGGERKEAGA